MEIITETDYRDRMEKEVVPYYELGELKGRRK